MQAWVGSRGLTGQIQGAKRKATLSLNGIAKNRCEERWIESDPRRDVIHNTLDGILVYLFVAWSPAESRKWNLLRVDD